jgi:hypothetical protein
LPHLRKRVVVSIIAFTIKTKARITSLIRVNLAGNYGLGKLQGEGGDRRAGGKLIFTIKVIPSKRSSNTRRNMQQAFRAGHTHIEKPKFF